MFSSRFAHEAGKQKQFDTSTTTTSVLSNPQRKTTDDSNINDRETEKAEISSSEPRLLPSRPKPQVANPSPLNPTPKGYTEFNPPAAPSATATPPTPPPDVFRDRHAAESGIPPNQNASFAPQDTAFGRYQRKLYLAIGSRWNLKVQQTMAKLGVERVIVNFQVMPDGTISDLRISQGDPNRNLDILIKYAIEQSGGLIGPFPADLSKEKPNGFPWQLAFRIY
jgi:outer membrane biosynthesis protein TonB